MRIEKDSELEFEPIELIHLDKENHIVIHK